MPRQLVLPFDGGTEATQNPFRRGGKGLGLAEMAKLNLPIPPGFTLDSGVHRAYLQHGCLPNRVEAQIQREIAVLERKTGYRFGDPENPLLVSVRSGAEQSMPGMMDTILNVGINPHDLSGLKRGGKRFAHRLLSRLREQWPEAELPINPYDQLHQAILGVFDSWNSERARAYREQYNIPSWKGTAVTIQQMVFGNRDHQSCTGVVFSANLTTGDEGLCGEFLPCAQGEDVVGGTRTPRSIAEFADWSSTLDKQLRAHVDLLAEYYGEVVDVEFTVESGELFLLQVRPAKLSLQAQIVRDVRDVHRGRLDKQDVLSRCELSNVAHLQRPSLSIAAEQAAEAEGRLVAAGLSASPGAVCGVVATDAAEVTRLVNGGHKAILVRRDTTPEDLPAMLKASAIVTMNGGATCHAAIVARELGIPAVVGVQQAVPPGQTVSVNGSTGKVFFGEVESSWPILPQEVKLFLRWWRKAHKKGGEIDFTALSKRLSANQILSDFYVLDILASRHPEKIQKFRADFNRRTAGAFALYLLMACAEMRHYNTQSGGVDSEVRAIEKLLGENLLSFTFRTDFQEHVVEKAKCMPSVQLLQLLELFVHVFREGRWSEAYGGKKWADIAETLLRYVTGEISPAIFIDAVFDLRHNGGQLFDKHVLFSLETDEFLLQSQLDQKKRLSPEGLWSWLQEQASPSEEVASLWCQLM